MVCDYTAQQVKKRRGFFRLLPKCAGGLQGLIGINRLIHVLQPVHFGGVLAVRIVISEEL